MFDFLAVGDKLQSFVRGITKWKSYATDGQTPCELEMRSVFNGHRKRPATLKNIWITVYTSMLFHTDLTGKAKSRPPIAHLCESDADA